MIYRLLCIFCLAIIFSVSSGQSRAELERQKVAALEEIRLSQELLQKTTEQKQVTLRRVHVLNEGINSRKNLISVIESELRILDDEIDRNETEIRSMERQIEKGKDEYAAIIINIYKNNSDYESLMYLLASENINQFYQRIKYLKYLTDYRQMKIRELQEMIVLLEGSIKNLQEKRDVKLSLLSQKELENRSLAHERNQRNQVVQKLSLDEKKLREKVAENERIRTELEDAIRKAIEEEAKKSSTNNLFSTLTPEQKLNGVSFSQNKGRLPWPVDRGIVTARFGLISHPVLKGVKINNNGVDISSAPNSKARAVFDGEVTKIFAILGANYTVLVMHGEFLSVYQNIVDLKVKSGDKVVTKQEIGTIYTDPEENMAVLHFQVWKAKEILDPSLWLSK